MPAALFLSPPLSRLSLKNGLKRLVRETCDFSLDCSPCLFVLFFFVLSPSSFLFLNRISFSLFYLSFFLFCFLSFVFPSLVVFLYVCVYVCAYVFLSFFFFFVHSSVPIRFFLCSPVPSQLRRTLFEN